MSCRQYTEEEKVWYVEEYKKGNQSTNEFAKENNIPGSTLRGWLKKDENMPFGRIQINQGNILAPKFNKNTIVFACENIRIELKENFNKALLTKIMEVLIDA